MGDTASAQDAIATFARRLSDATSENERRKIFSEFLKQQRHNARQQNTLYPLHPPNSKCRTAVIGGVRLSNGAGLRPGNVLPYFTFGPEKAYVWTSTPNEYSSLVVKVDSSEANRKALWKTLGTCTALAGSFSSAFEHVQSCSYHWIYRFRPGNSLDNQEFYREFDAMEAASGTIHNLLFFAEIAPLLHLLLTDDQFFSAAQRYYASVTSHWFCLQCELGPPQNVHHPSHEPESWERAAIVPNLENALVQACRVAETLVGQPGTNRQRVITRWVSAVGISPGDQFSKARKSYIDALKDLYDIRNRAAHGQDKRPFNATRRSVVEAQCLAWKLLSAYFRKHVRSQEEATRLLKFNRSLLRREVMPEFMTKMTEPEYQARNLQLAARKAILPNRGRGS